MGFKNNKEYTFADLEIEQKLESVSKNHFLFKLNSLVDFELMRPTLSKNSLGSFDSYGQKAYDCVMMYKILLIQKFYNLSDKQTEENINVNLIFMNFLNCSISSPLPDHSTICRFRNSLISNNLYEELFHDLNNILEEQGYLAKNAVIIDASLIKSHNVSVTKKSSEEYKANKLEVESSNDKIELEIQEVIASKDDNSKKSKKITTLIGKKQNASRTLKNDALDKLQSIDSKLLKSSQEIISKGLDSYDKNNQADTEIRIGKSSSRPEYVSGIKCHIMVDAVSGMVIDQTISFANTSENQTVKLFVDRNDVGTVYGDKAYSSKKNDDFLKSKKIDNKISKKKINNSTNNKTRVKVEHTYSVFKKELGYHTTRYTGLVRNALNFTLCAIAVNLKKLTHKRGKSVKLDTCA